MPLRFSFHVLDIYSAIGVEFGLAQLMFASGSKLGCSNPSS